MVCGFGGMRDKFDPISPLSKIGNISKAIDILPQKLTNLHHFRNNGKTHYTHL
jgi:hypothetical protein